MKQVNYKINIKTEGAEKNVKALNQDLSSTDKEVKSVNKSGKGLGDTFNKLGISMKAIGTGAVVAGVGAIVGVFTSAIKKGAEFAKQMSTLQAVSGATQEEIKALSSSAKELGASTQFTAVQVGELQTEFAKMGFTTKQILASTKATLDLAASMEVDLASAAMLAGSTVNAFGLQAEDTQRVVDVLAKSTSSSALDFGSLTESLKVAAPIAKSTGRSIEEVTAMLGVLANTGLKGSVAGTGLSKTFIELNKKGIELKDALEQVNQSSDGLNTAIELVGVVGAKSLLNLASKSEDIGKLTKSFQNAEGAAKRMAEVRLDNLAGDTTKLSSAFEGFLLSIEDGEGFFNSLIRGIVQATTALLNFLTPTKLISESLDEERVALFGVEAELRNVNTTQERRNEIIKTLQDKYPDYLGNVDAETISNEELSKALRQVNEDLVNKILIQEKQEEIEEQAIKTASKLNNLRDAQNSLNDRANIIRDKYNKLGIRETPEGLDALGQALFLEKELIRVREEQNELRLKGDPAYKLETGALNELSSQQQRLRTAIEQAGKAQDKFDSEMNEGNVLLADKTKLMEDLGMSTKEVTEATEETTEANKNLQLTNSSLIEEQQFLLEQAKQLPETTEKELIVKNKKIASINKEIKRLKELGVETKKLTKEEKEALKTQEDALKAAKARGGFVVESTKSVNLQIVEEQQSLNQMLAQLYGEDVLAFQEGQEQKRLENLNEVQNRLDLASQAANSIQSIGDAVFAHRLKNVEKGSKEEEKLARKQFRFNKALQLGLAVIDSAKAITSSLSQSPIAIGPVPNPAGIASLAFAAATSAANIATIAAQKFQGGSTVPSSVNDASAAGSIGSQAPAFNVVGQSGFNQVAQALGQQNSTPIKAFVVSGDVTSAQALENNIIDTATF